MKKDKKIQIRWYVGNPVKEKIIGYIEQDKFVFKTEKIKNECLEQLKEICEKTNSSTASLCLRDLNRDRNKVFLKHLGFLYTYTTTATPSNPNLIALTYNR